MAQAVIQYMPQVAAQMGLVDASQLNVAQNANNGVSGVLGEGTAEERAARKTTDDTRTARARETARKTAEAHR